MITYERSTLDSSEKYIGLDVHQATISVAVMDSQGKIIMESILEAYAYVPANHEHQESCLDGCMYYVIREGAADVHYLNPAGKEIAPEIALATVGERPAVGGPVNRR
jgi:hypothetical protein